MASPVVNYTTLGMDISLWMRSRARNNLQAEHHARFGSEFPESLERLSEMDLIRLVRMQSSCADTEINRDDFCVAFDPISVPEKGTLPNNGSLEASSFDRPTSIIASDLAPYVRSIVAYDARLQQDRVRMSNLLSEGGRRGKRMRTTRAAMSALEGGARRTTRRDKYFGSDLNPYLVLKTGMQSWLDVSMENTNQSSASRASSLGANGVEVERENTEWMTPTS